MTSGGYTTCQSAFNRRLEAPIGGGAGIFGGTALRPGRRRCRAMVGILLKAASIQQSAQPKLDNAAMLDERRGATEERVAARARVCKRVRFGFKRCHESHHDRGQKVAVAVVAARGASKGKRTRCTRPQRTRKPRPRSKDLGPHRARRLDRRGRGGAGLGGRPNKRIKAYDRIRQAAELLATGNQPIGPCPKPCLQAQPWRRRRGQQKVARRRRPCSQPTVGGRQAATVAGGPPAIGGQE